MALLFFPCLLPLVADERVLFSIFYINVYDEPLSKRTFFFCSCLRCPVRDDVIVNLSFFYSFWSCWWEFM